MYSHIYIRCKFATFRYKTNDSDGIYDRLIALGCSHGEAENIAAWAENAPIGEEYECQNEKLVVTIDD